LPSLLAELANTLARAAADDETAGAISRNLECWAEDLYQLAELLLLAAIARKSHFTFDMIHWVAHVTKVLVVISNGPACRQHTKEELREHARRLLLVFSRIPDDKNAISFVESSQMTEVLFESAMDALSYDCPELVESAATLLLDWAFKAGRHHTGWALLERSLYGAAAFALVRGVPNEVAALKVKITAAVNKASAPDQELRDRAGRNMRRRANTLYRNGHMSSGIEQTMSRLDHTILAPLLIDIANLLSPISAKESELDRD
jgi:hypothetical protein